MVENETIVPRHLCKIGPGYEAIICFTYCKRSKPEGGGRFRNESARIGMLALFQDQQVSYSHGQIATSLVPRPSHM